MKHFIYGFFLYTLCVNNFTQSFYNSNQIKYWNRTFWTIFLVAQIQVANCFRFIKSHRQLFVSRCRRTEILFRKEMMIWPQVIKTKMLWFYVNRIWIISPRTPFLLPNWYWAVSQIAFKRQSFALNPCLWLDQIHNTIEIFIVKICKNQSNIRFFTVSNCRQTSDETFVALDLYCVVDVFSMHPKCLRKSSSGKRELHHFIYFTIRSQTKIHYFRLSL